MTAVHFLCNDLKYAQIYSTKLYRLMSLLFLILLYRGRVFSTKLGKRAHNLHLQGLFRTLFPNDSKVLSAFIKVFCLKKGADIDFWLSSLLKAKILSSCLFTFSKTKGSHGFNIAPSIYPEKIANRMTAAYYGTHGY